MDLADSIQLESHDRCNYEERPVFAAKPHPLMVREYMSCRIYSLSPPLSPASSPEPQCIICHHVIVYREYN